MTTPEHGIDSRFCDPSIMQSYESFLEDIAEPLEISYKDQAELRRSNPGYWITWSLAVLAGQNELKIIQPTDQPNFASRRAQELMCAPGNGNCVTTYDVTTGILGDRFNELVAADVPLAIEQVNRACADFTHTLAAALGDQKPLYGAELTRALPQTLLGYDAKKDATAVQFSNYRIPDCLSTVIVDRPMTRVATLGPGLSGEAFAASAIAAGTKDIHFVSGGPGAQFVNNIIDLAAMDTQSAIYDDRQNNPKTLVQHFPHMPLEAINMPRAYYYSQGIAGSMERLSHNLQGAQLDAFVMSAVHAAGRAECLAGAQAAPDMLTTGGLFVLKLPQKANGNFAGYNTIEPTLRQAFGEPAFIEQSPLDLTSPANKGVTYPVPATLAIYVKK